MPVAPGTRLGPYEVTGRIGMGGMGEIYEATDTTLGRAVAIKVLPDSFASDPERLARFDREARTLAALNHPNIAAIYGVERSGGHAALIMELVEGPTLADRIAGGPIALDETLSIAGQIADALDAAHQRGIVHRDLKPANIKVRDDGTVKVLDFGLAKLVEPERLPRDVSLSPTITSPAQLTVATMILGTAAYMAPEQARGRAVDRRADIWSFGCVVYEMVTGRRAFEGETFTDILAQVLEREPPMERVPPAVRPLLRRCLIKDPAKRLRDIGDAMALVDVSDAPASAGDKGASRWMWPAIAAVCAAAAVVSLWVALAPRAVEPALSAQFAIQLPPRTSGPPFPVGVAISRDGSQLAFASGGRIYRRSLGELDVVAVPGTENGVFPAFSPDGKWLAFSYTDGSLHRVPVAGGSPQMIVPAFEGGMGNVHWGADGNIFIGNARGLFRVPFSGGTPERLASVDAAKGETSFRAPQLLPGSRAVLFSAIGERNESQAVVLNLDTKDRVALPGVAGEARYVSAERGRGPGHLLFVARGDMNSMSAVRFDVGRVEVIGTPELVLDGIASGGPVMFDVSEDGTLVYFPGADAPANSSLVWLTRTGAEQPIAGAAPRPYGSVAISPDGRRVALQVASPTGADVWVYDVDRETIVRRTFTGRAFNPMWGPDMLIYRNGNGPTSALYSIPAGDEVAQPTPLTGPGRLLFPTSVPPDGRLLIGTEGLGAQNQGFVVRFAGSGKNLESAPEPLLDRAGAKNGLEFSPDGHWVVYQSTETGRSEVFVAPFPGPGKIQVSHDGGGRPHWSPDGRELFYVSGSNVMVVSVETSPTFRTLGPPRILFSSFYSRGVGWDVAPDKRFLMVKPDATVESARSELLVVTNWFEELLRKAPGPAAR